MTAFDILQVALLVPVVGGGVYGLLCVWAAGRFFARPVVRNAYRPPVTVLKPLYGLDKDLENNLRSLCTQDYPDYQVVLAVQRVDDPALPLLRRLAAEFPGRVTLVVHPSEPVVNGKVQNMCNALTAARHDILVISDSDVRAGAAYIADMVAPLADENVGYTCSIYRSVAADRWFEKFELLNLNVDFVPSLMFSSITGAAHFCIGASTALRRSDLDRVGGMAALGQYLVEDHEMGKRIKTLGKRMVLVPHVIEIVCDYPSFPQWWRHQVYWDQNTWAANPTGFALTILTRAVPFALLFAALRTFDATGLIVLLSTISLRMVTAAWISGLYLDDREGVKALWLLPLRDIIALASWYAALTRRTFEWRGHEFGLTRDGKIVPRGPLPLQTADSEAAQTS